MKELFQVAIVGRANVGKSSLFNALLKTRRSIVFDEAGTTRDFIREETDLGAGMLALIDTQGIFEEGDELALEGMLAEADAMLFVTDAIDGVTTADRRIFRVLKKHDVPILVVANKSDVKRAEDAAQFSEFAADGALGVSVTHRRGLGEVIEWIVERQKQSELAGQEKTEPEVTLALIGKPNVGKSTMMNYLCQKEVSRVSPVAHTTRDPVAFELETPHGIVKLIDTAGIRRPRSKKEDIEVFSIQAATRMIRAADVVFLLIAAHEPPSDQDLRLLSLVERSGKPTAVLFTFWDKLKGREKKDYLENSDFYQRLTQFARVEVSAVTGLNTSRLIPLAFRLSSKSQKRIPTSKLNRIVEKLVAKNPPPAYGKGVFNILYASQVKVAPPTFVFFVNRKQALPESYYQYLSNQLSKELNYTGQPIRLFFRSGRSDRHAR